MDTIFQQEWETRLLPGVRGTAAAYGRRGTGCTAGAEGRKERKPALLVLIVELISYTLYYSRTSRAAAVCMNPSRTHTHTHSGTNRRRKLVRSRSRCSQRKMLFFACILLLLQQARSSGPKKQRRSREEAGSRGSRGEERAEQQAGSSRRSGDDGCGCSGGGERVPGARIGSLSSPRTFTHSLVLAAASAAAGAEHSTAHTAAAAYILPMSKRLSFERAERSAARTLLLPAIPISRSSACAILLSSPAAAASAAAAAA